MKRASAWTCLAVLLTLTFGAVPSSAANRDWQQLPGIGNGFVDELNGEPDEGSGIVRRQDVTEETPVIRPHAWQLKRERLVALSRELLRHLIQRAREVCR